MVGKVELLEIAMRDAGIDVIGLQESRSRQAGIFNGPLYRRYCGAADDNGNAGCQLWIAASWNFAMLTMDDISPRLLVVTGRREGYGTLLNFVVAHAPCEHATNEEKTTFWTLFNEAMRKLKNDRVSRRIVFIDANARTSADEPFVGACDPEPCNDNGERLIAAMKVDGMVAVNTFYPCGYTWRSAKGHTSRIDYVLYDAVRADEIKTCGIAHTVDLACGAAEDHRCVQCSIEVKGGTGIGNNRRKKKKINIDTSSIQNPFLCAEFQRRMWAFAPKPGNSVSDHAEELSSFLLKHAREVFGEKGRKPRLPWISRGTWCAAWMASKTSEFAPGDQQLGPRRSWKAYGMHQEWTCKASRSFYLASALWVQADRLKRMVKPAIIADKLAFLEWNAKEARRLASSGDSHGMYCIVRALAGRKQNGVALPIYKQDGTLTRGDEERELRWQEHFAGVFGGRVSDIGRVREEHESFASVASGSQAISHREAESDPVLAKLMTPSAVECAVATLKKRKGIGPDGVSSEMLQAGGSAVAVKLAEIHERVILGASWPFGWTGGRIHDIYKHKGNPAECDNSRGILLMSHCGKPLCKMLAAAIGPQYNSAMPDTQFGATAHRGADFATHVLVTFMEICRKSKKSFFVLFVDLVKAFDRVIRELVFGIPPGVTDVNKYLSELGLSMSQLDFVTSFIARHGSLFEVIGVHPRVIQLVCNLHASSWVTYGSLESAIIVKVGGRQGCVFGSMVFNTPYALALMALNDELMDRGVVMRIHDGNVTNETSDNSCEEAHHVLDVTFVDDECIMLAADDSRSLADAIDCCTLVLSTTFQLLKLEVNWRPGKTECFVQMRGKQGRDIVEKWRREDGSLSIPVPQCDTRINVVDRYRHLGTIVMANGNDVPNARLRAKSAKEAYGPLALRVFGSGHIPAPLKLSLCMSLVESRNSFSMHIAPPSFNALRIVASVYNRALRRIAGTPRFEKDEHALSDIESRRALKVPSYDCILMRGRLRYVGRIVRTRPTTLVAMLSVRFGEPPVPPEWFVRVQEDLQYAWKTVAILTSAPPPDLEAPFWVGVMKDNERWAQIVKSVHFFESALDNRAAMKRTIAAALSKSCECSVCSMKFASERALAAHSQRGAWLQN